MSAANTTMQPLVLRFTEWRCGHHGQRPADIEVSSPEQALLIARAISHAISQPGHARAALMTADAFEDLYITDDYVSAGHGGETSAIKDPLYWAPRPIVIYGTEAEISELRSAELAAAVDSVYGGEVIELDDAAPLYGGEIACSTLPLEELERLAAPLEWHESRRHPFAAPPVFKAAAVELPALRAEAFDLANPPPNVADLVAHWTDSRLGWTVARRHHSSTNRFAPAARVGQYLVFSEVLDLQNYPGCYAVCDDFGTLVPLVGDHHYRMEIREVEA